MNTDYIYKNFLFKYYIIFLSINLKNKIYVTTAKFNTTANIQPEFQISILSRSTKDCMNFMNI